MSTNGTNGTNGNGAGNTKDLIKREVEGLPPWLAAMRQAAMEAVQVEDVKAIVEKQIELAKQGDHKAMKFVFEQVLGGNQMKGMTLIQNNYHVSDPDVARPDKPTDALPGSRKKLDMMARRAEAGLPLTDGRDRERVDLS